MPKQEFYGFEPPSREDWINRLTSDLKGKDFKAFLTKNIADNVTLNAALFPNKDSAFSEDIGAFPFSRGHKLMNNAYRIEQSFDASDEKNTNQQILESLLNGSSSVGLYNFSGTTNLTRLFDKVETSFICIGLKGKIEINQIEIFLTQNYQNIFITVDPHSKNCKIGLPEYLSLIQRQNGKHHGRHYFGIDGVGVANAGGNDVTELVYCIASAHEILHQLIENGLALNEANRMISFNLGIGADYLVQVAKIRALRALWANVLKAYKPEEGYDFNTWVHGETVTWNKLNDDKDTNILRATTEGMSAILGGVDSLEMNHSNIGDLTEDRQYRVARNIHHLLSEESYLNQVSDPLGGSYHIEDLSKQLMDAAWVRFKQIEDNGGISACMSEISKQIEKDKTKIIESVTDNTRALIGGNKFRTDDLAFDASEDLIFKNW